MMTSREQFEKLITSPPYEKDISKNGEKSPWPNRYKDYDVYLAWEFWQASRAWKKFAEDTPHDRSKILIKGFDEVFLFQFGKVFCLDGDEFDFIGLEWQYRPE